MRKHKERRFNLLISAGGFFCCRESLGGAERRQPRRGSPRPHFIIPRVFPVLPLPLPAGERQQRARPDGNSARECARPAAHHPVLRLHGAGHGVPRLPKQPWLQTHRLDVNPTPTAPLRWKPSPEHHTPPRLIDVS